MAVIDKEVDLTVSEIDVIIKIAGMGFEQFQRLEDELVNTDLDKRQYDQVTENFLSGIEKLTNTIRGALTDTVNDNLEDLK